MPTPDPFAPLEIVLVDPQCRDEALADEMDFEKYAETRDPELIKERPGTRALRFRLTPITRTFLIEKVDAQEAGSMRWAMAVMGGCHSFVDERGEKHESPTYPVKGDTPQRMAPAKWITGELLDVIPIEGVYEIGREVRRRAALPKPRTPRSD